MAPERPGFHREKPFELHGGHAIGVGGFRLVDYIAQHRVDFLDLTPSYLRQLLPAGLLTDSRHRPRVLMLGGEALSESLWQELAAAGDTRSYNFYGPTEASIEVTAYACRPGDTSIPIGTP